MSTRPIKISEETYQTLKMMKQNLFPFPVSFSKVVGYATDKLNEELLYAKEKAKKDIEDKESEIWQTEQKERVLESKTG